MGHDRRYPQDWSKRRYGRIFYLDDAEDVRDFAFEKSVGRIAMWSVNRDRQCENSWDPLHICSHIEQVDFEFSYLFQQNGAINYCEIVSGGNGFVTSPTMKSYPNPAADYLVFTGCVGAGIKINGLDGTLIKESRITYDNYVLNISDIKSGTYVILINLNNIATYKKIVILR